MKNKFWARHFEGMGGIKALLPIAVPMILSNVFDTAMTVIDRLFLGYVGKEQMAACMGGGVTAWTCMTLFVGIVSYVGAMVARSYGANKKKNCIAIAYQGMYLSLFSYPLILIIGFFAAKSFVWAGHDPLEARYELIYFRYMIIGASSLAALRMTLASFFVGLGKTKIIMYVNAVALITNVGINYILVFGKLGFPALGIHGAAIGTLVADVVITALLYFEFRKYSHKKEFENATAKRLNWKLMKGLLHFGSPTGLDNMLSTSAFAVVVSLFHGFGANSAAALTIVLNWDMCTFLVMMGIQIAVTSLVSQCLGAENKDEAERAACSGFKINFCFALVFVVLFLGFPRVLVSLFTPENQGIDYSGVISLAVPMLRAASCYLLFDCFYTTFSGALRGGGDTMWSMIIGIVFNWFLTCVLLVSIYLLKLPMLYCWYMWVGFFFIGGIWVYLRFKTGHWKNFDILNQKDPLKIIEEL